MLEQSDHGFLYINSAKHYNKKRVDGVSRATGETPKEKAHLLWYLYGDVENHKQSILNFLQIETKVTFKKVNCQKKKF